MLATHINDAERWDTIHQKTHKQDNFPSSYAKEKEKLFPRSSLIIELGGGTGEDAIYFLKQGHSVVILDISEFALRVAEEKAKRLSLMEHGLYQNGQKCMKKCLKWRRKN